MNTDNYTDNFKYFFTNSFYEFLKLEYKSYTIDEIKEFLAKKFFSPKKMFKPSPEFKQFFKIKKHTLTLYELTKVIKANFILNKDMSEYYIFSPDQKPIYVYSLKN